MTLFQTLTIFLGLPSMFIGGGIVGATLMYFWTRPEYRI